MNAYAVSKLTGYKWSIKQYPFHQGYRIESADFPGLFIGRQPDGRILITNETKEAIAFNVKRPVKVSNNVYLTCDFGISSTEVCLLLDRSDFSTRASLQQMTELSIPWLKKIAQKD